ncbi:hypothetical protein B0H14DRAFT_2636208 [Mycena olivaceomarginata]|nr:hypothetical protein B0H14DRAFT_2636208 [Mycena olivaceomarginata]
MVQSDCVTTVRVGLLELEPLKVRSRFPMDSVCAVLYSRENGVEVDSLVREEAEPLRLGEFDASASKEGTECPLSIDSIKAEKSDGLCQVGSQGLGADEGIALNPGEVAFVEGEPDALGGGLVGVIIVTGTRATVVLLFATGSGESSFIPLGLGLFLVSDPLVTSVHVWFHKLLDLLVGGDGTGVACGRSGWLREDVVDREGDGDPREGAGLEGSDEGRAARGGVREFIRH